jgi:DNA invertase Pin-like site-specific DNA recombinase
MQVHDFVQVEISSRRSSQERRIDELLARLHEGDVLLVAALSRLGRNYPAYRYFVRQDPELLDLWQAQRA